MFASNFPVDKLKADYPSLWRGFATVCTGFSESERAAMFRDNAFRTYRIEGNA